MLQAADEAAELRTRLARTEANLKAVHNEAAEGETALASLNEELQKLQGALAQAAKVGQLGLVICLSGSRCARCVVWACLCRIGPA